MAIKCKNKALFSQSAREYIVNLCTKEELGKLRVFLFDKLLMEKDSAENRFLGQYNIAGAQICRNCLPILDSFKCAEALSKELQIALDNYESNVWP